MSSEPTAHPRTFYITTPIYYVNARPHIGHAYTTIVADVLARRHRLLGDDTFFLTGTDEHGQKIERSAQAAGIPPQQFADEVSASFRALWERMGITNDRFIRTTDDHHKQGVQQLFTELYERGFIYLSSYTGQYSVGEEMFVEGPPGTLGPDGKPTETLTEENFFFKLSAFQKPLLDLIESGTLKVEPEARRNEVLSFLRGNIAAVVKALMYETGVVDYEVLERIAVQRGLLMDPDPDARKRDYYVPGALKDLSISRSSFTWGVPVPEPAASLTQETHVIYVWLDALANYMTAVGYGAESDPTLSEGARAHAKAEFNKWWPADLHLVGKEIIRFHCVYWPAFLLALNPALQHDSKGPVPELSFAQQKQWAAEKLPKAITAHGWLLFDNSKMSKSKGNIVRTETILDAFGRLCPPLPIDSSGLSFRSAAEESASPAPQAEVRPPTDHERDLFAADVLRYFLLREIPFGQDGSFSFEAMVTRYNADLVNGYGNLVSRVVGLTTRALGGRLYPGNQPRHVILRAEVDIALVEQIDAAFTSSEFSKGLSSLQSLITSVDGMLNARAPWKRDPSLDETTYFQYQTDILRVAADAIRIVTILLRPILPDVTMRVWRQLGLGEFCDHESDSTLLRPVWNDDGFTYSLGPLSPVFPRADKNLIQIMTDMENTAATPQHLTTVNNAHDTTTPDTSPFPEAPLSSAASSTGAPNLKDAATPTPAAPVATSTTDPAAPPRSFNPLDEPAGTLPVGGSLAEKPTLPTTPGPATQAPASGAFGGTASQVSIASQPSDAAPQIGIDDFAKVEMRVAQVLVAERIPKADKLLRLEVDLGHEKRQILSGIAEWYQPEDLVGRRIVVITNLAPRKMRGLESHGMLLAASDGEGGKPILATFGEDIALGSRLK